jgi:uracil-DNA glycosylase
LNTVLTVRFNEPNSHAKKGWEQFTDEVIRVLLKHTEQKDGDVGIVFLLWGAPAQNKLASIIQQFSKKKHTVITSSHPSPLGASKTHQPFLGSKCFSRVNDALIKMKVDPIDWDVDD